nr:hypothetical protein [Planctomycetota bacterium]
MKPVRAAGLLAALACCGGLWAQDGAAPAYRTDAANPGAAWYQLRPLEFPPRDSAHAIAGTLVAADFIHRSGTFRAADGTLRDFAMLPYGTALYAGAEAELRDVPLGTSCVFHLHPDATGAFTRLAAMEDDFSAAVAQGTTWRLDAVHDGTLATTMRRAGADAGGAAFAVDAATRVWKGEA